MPDASFANHGTFQQTAYVTTPLGSDAALLLSANNSSTHGFYRNIFLDDHHSVDDQKVTGLDGRLVFRPSTDTTIDFKTHFERLRGASIAYNAAFPPAGFRRRSTPRSTRTSTTIRTASTATSARPTTRTPPTRPIKVDTTSARRA